MGNSPSQPNFKIPHQYTDLEVINFITSNSVPFNNYVLIHDSYKSDLVNDVLIYSLLMCGTYKEVLKHIPRTYLLNLDQAKFNQLLKCLDLKSNVKYIPDKFKTLEICDKIALLNIKFHKYIPSQYISEEIINNYINKLSVSSSLDKTFDECNRELKLVQWLLQQNLNDKQLKCLNIMFPVSVTLNTLNL